MQNNFENNYAKIGPHVSQKQITILEKVIKIYFS